MLKTQWAFSTYISTESEHTCHNVFAHIHVHRHMLSIKCNFRGCSDPSE